MGEMMKKTSGLRQALFNKPILKLFLVLLLIVVGFTLAQTISIPVLRFIVAMATVIAVLYSIILIGHIVALYLIKKPLGRLLSAKDIISLLFSYVMLIVGILLVMSVLFIAVEELHLGYLTHGPTTDGFNSDVIDSGDPNLSHDYLYFTAITFFTVGYGDICPMGLCKPLAVVTAFAGNIVTVVLMAIAVSVYLNRRTKEADRIAGAE
ncbi:MAG: ion channel [Dehalococcoidia bacterium]|nr:ion channel [Dehalococcoidia bacterium]